MNLKRKYKINIVFSPLLSSNACQPFITENSVVFGYIVCSEQKIGGCPFFGISEFDHRKHLKYKLLINIVNAIVHRCTDRHSHIILIFSILNFISLCSFSLEIDDWNDNMKLSFFSFILDEQPKNGISKQFNLFFSPLKDYKPFHIHYIASISCFPNNLKWYMEHRT